MKKATGIAKRSGVIVERVRSSKIDGLFEILGLPNCLGIELVMPDALFGGCPTLL
jgi:hypothetical protein